MIVECVAPVGDRCGEGIVWDDADQVLYWCDINRFLVHRFDPATSSVRSWSFDEPVVAVVLTRDPGRLLLALGSRLIHWRPSDDGREDIGFELRGYPRVRLNDGRADRQGNLWIGSMQNNVRADGDLDQAVEGSWALPGHGKLFRVGRDGVHTVHRENVGISNTVCWSPDGSTFYFGDSLANEIRAFDFHASTSTIGSERPYLAGFHRGGPDGSAVDSLGRLWNCRFGGGCLVRILPDGRVDGIVEMPCSDVTTCTFGGPDLRTLYVTTASMRQHRGERLAGSLFAIRCDTPGLPEHRASL